MTARKDERVQQFETLALPHLKSLHNLARHLTRNPADAEDLVQETYLKGFEHFDRFQLGTNFRAWIFKILRNTFINQYHKGRSKLQVDLETVEPTLGTPSGHDAVAARVDTSSATFRAALASLSETTRTMLILAYIEGFTYNEIAQVMSCPLGTVMSRLFRGRRQLRDKLQISDAAAAKASAAA